VEASASAGASVFSSFFFEPPAFFAFFFFNCSYYNKDFSPEVRTDFARSWKIDVGRISS
jgi:hypothetical protein